MDTTIEHEAQTSLSQLLERVSQGERITITKHGVPVAVMQPPVPGRKMTVAEAIADLEALSKEITLGRDITIRELIEEGRR